MGRLVDRVKLREYSNGSLYPPIKFKNENMVTSNFVQNICHSLTLHGHDGCVNTINWNESGTLLASGSDDQSLIIWEENGRLLRRIQTAHTNNIFSVLFVPGVARDHLVLSAAGDYTILLHDIESVQRRPPPIPRGSARPEQTPNSHLRRWECNNRVKRLAINRAEPRIFWSASEDGIVKQFDLRDNDASTLIDLSSTHQLKTLATNESRPEMLALGLNDPIVPIYDRRFLSQPLMRLAPAHLTFHQNLFYRQPLVTHLDFSRNGDEIIANIGSDNIYIFDIRSGGENSPNVFSALKSALTGDPLYQWTSRTPTDLIKNGKCEQFFTVADDKRKHKDQSKLIDRCSDALNEYAKKHMIDLPTLLNTKACYYDDSNDKKHDREGLVHFLLVRGKAYLQRDWEGDSIAAIRDFLSALRINASVVEQKELFSNLFEALISMKQQDLARECYEQFKTFFSDSENLLKDMETKLKEQTDNDDNGRKRRSSSSEKVKQWKGTLEDGKTYFDYRDRFLGHFNVNTDIKEAKWFYGGGSDPNRPQFVVAGSDCANMFIWDRDTQRVIRLLKADEYTVNCIQPHPSRCLLASSGIDNVIRYWEPQSTALKALGNREFPEENEDRNVTSKIYEQMRKNRKPAQPPDVVWTHLLNTMSMGIGGFEFIPHENADQQEEQDEDSREHETQTIRCRTM